METLNLILEPEITIERPRESKTAVLFIVFNRPDVTAQVFEAIRHAKPPRLYVAADGPRDNQNGEVEQCEKVREIATSVDWPCVVETLFQERNLGPMHAQVSALEWFFEREAEGIILEDDCLPDESFFDYCDELLCRYRNDQRVFMISGNNFQRGKRMGDADYYFSIYNHIWGWATWRRSWQCFDKDIVEWPNFKKMGGIESLHRSSNTRRFWCKLFDAIYSGKYDRGWDYRFLFACWRENGLVVIPQVNLVKNIGFGVGGTNCMERNSPFSCMKTGHVSMPIRHPSIIQRNLHADEKTSEEMFSTNSLFMRALSYLLKPHVLATKCFKKIYGIAL